MPAASASVLLRLVALGLQRHSRAGPAVRSARTVPAPGARTRRPVARAAGAASQSGRLWRSFSGSAPRSMAFVHLGQPLPPPAGRCAPRRQFLVCPARPAQQGGARARRCPLWARCCEEQPLAQHGVGGLGQRMALAVCPGRGACGSSPRPPRCRRVRRTVSSVPQQLRGEVEQGVRVHVQSEDLAGAIAHGARRPAVELELAFDEPAHGQRVDHVLGGLSTRAASSIVRRRRRRTGTTDFAGRWGHGPVRASRSAPWRPPPCSRPPCARSVRVQAWEGGQQRGVDVQHAGPRGGARRPRPARA